MSDFSEEPMGDEPMPEMGGGEAPMGEPMGDDMPWEDEEPFDAGVEAEEESDPKNFIQQLSGKLAQSLRDYHNQNETDLDLEKFAVNSVISATHTGQMEPGEQGDIIEKIKTAGTDSYETKDEKEGEDDDEPSMEDPMATGGMPSNPASPPAPGGMGESFERKEVFADPKLGVPDEESNFYPLQKENFNDDFEDLSRSVEYGIEPEVDDFEDFDFNVEEESNNNLEISDKKDSFVSNPIDSAIQRMVQDYLNTQQGFKEEEENMIQPETKPTTEPTTTPTKRPSRRDSPYRIHEQPGVNPKPKAKK